MFLRDRDFLEVSKAWSRLVSKVPVKDDEIETRPRLVSVSSALADPHNTSQEVTGLAMCVGTRRIYFSAILMYRIHHFSKPSYLADLFRHYQSRKAVRGESKDWAITIVRMNTGLSSFQIKGAHSAVHIHL